jgi:hypothetical protein
MLGFLPPVPAAPPAAPPTGGDGINPPTGEDCFSVWVNPATDFRCKTPCSVGSLTVFGYQLLDTGLTDAQVLAKWGELGACVPPTNLGSSGGQCYQLPNGQQITLGSNDAIPAGAKPCLGSQVQPGTRCGPLICPPPDMPASPEAPNKLGPLPLGRTPTDCSNLDQFAKQFKDFTLYGLLKDYGAIDKDGFFGGLGAAYKNAVAVDYVGPLLGWVVKGVNIAIIFPMAAVGSFFESLAAATKCPSGPLAVYAGIRVFTTWTRRLLGAGTDKIEQQVIVSENYICPTGIATIQDANLCRMRGEITEEQWRCWVRLNNIHEATEEPVYQAGRELLSVPELSRAYLRGYLSNDGFDASLQERGMLNKNDRSLSFQLTEFMPPPTDVLHFIVRGLGDTTTVKRFGLLEEFDLLYSGQLKQWGKAAGISDETMGFYHAAHWVVPAPGQLNTMLQRLRPDNIPQGVKADKWVVSLDDVNRALRENAYAPFWRGPLVNIAYNPIGRRDLLQAFQRGILDDAGFISRIRDLGFTPENAQLIAATYKARILDTIRKETWYKLYSQSAVTYDQAFSELSSAGYTPDLIGQALNRADQEADAATRVTCLKAVGRQFATGGLLPSEVSAFLLQAGLDIQQTQRLIVQWSCQAKTRGKEIPAEKLCKWYAGGLITAPEMTARLVRVGYTDVDALRIVAECVASTDEARLKARQKAYRDQQLALLRAQKAGAYVTRQQQLGTAAMIKALTAQLKARDKALFTQERIRASEAAAAMRAAERSSRALARAASMEAREEARIQVAAEVFAARAGLESGNVASWLLQAWAEAQSQLAGDSDTALEAVLLAAHDKRALDLPTFQALAQSAIQAAAGIESAVSPPPPTTVNGSLPGPIRPLPVPPGPSVIPPGSTVPPQNLP